MRQTRTFIAASLAAFTLMGGVAFAADGLVVDGDLSDGISLAGPQLNPQSEALEFGNVCTGDSLPATQVDNVSMRVVAGNNDANRFANSATVAFVVQEITNANVANGVVTSTTPGSITLVDWDAAATNAMSGPTTARVSLSVPADAEEGVYSATVGYRGTGAEEGGGTTDVNKGLAVTWTVLADDDEACATAVNYSAVFKQPLDAGGILNKAKLGRVIPVKLNVLGDDDPQSEDTDGPVYFGSHRVSCPGTTQTDAIEQYVSSSSSNVGNTFRWDPDGQFWIFNLDTGKLPGATVNNCYEVDVYHGGTVTGGIGSGGDEIGTVVIQLLK